MKIQPYVDAPRVISLMYIALFAAVLACVVFDPENWTPSPPQLTAGALNATYDAYASETARPTLISTSTPETPPVTATASETPSPTLTWSIIEVTSCGDYICEVSP